MKKIEIYLIYTLVIIFNGCSSESNKQVIDEYVNSEGQHVIEYQLNDSIIERVMKKNNKIEAKELENTVSDTIEVFYYNEDEKLYQSLKFNTKNSKSLIENYIHFADGGVAEKYIKNHDNETLASFKYNFFDKLEKANYYREGQLDINSFVSYKYDGKIDTRKGKSSYVLILENSDSLSFHLVGTDKNNYRIITFQIFDKYPEKSDETVRLLYEKQFQNAAFISIAKSELREFKSNLHCSVQYIHPEQDGIMNTVEQELFIESLDKIPSNNLFYIRNK